MVRRLNFQKFLRQPAGAGKGSTRTSTIKPKNPKRPLKAEAGEKGVATSQKTRRTFTVRIQPGITRMVAAALITCVFPWIIILACCAGVYFSTSSNPWIVDIVWTDSLAVGSSIWALGFATPLHFTLGKAATMSLIPLGLWIAYLWLGAHLAHRLVLESKTILWVYPFAQALVATLVGLVVRGAYSLGELFFWALLHGFIVVGYAFYLFDREQRPKEVKPALRNFKSRLKYRLDYLNAQSRALRARLVNPDYAYSQDLENRRLGIDRDERSWDGASSTWTVPGWVVSGVRSGWKVFVFFGFITLILVLTQVFFAFFRRLIKSMTFTEFP